MTTYSTAQKPNLVTAIAVMTLLSGIVNIFWGLIASLTVLATLVGVVCTPFTVLPTISADGTMTMSGRNLSRFNTAKAWSTAFKSQ